MDTDPKWTLVERFQAGDRAAFADIYRTYQPQVFRFVFFRIRSRELAEDLTADTFLRALRQLDRVVWQGRDLAAWLVTIARNLVADHYKSGRTRYESLHPSGDLFTLDKPDSGPAAEDLAMAAVTRRQLREALNQLTDEQRQAVTLRYVHGLSVDEAAAAMHKHPGAVKALTWRAVQQMRREASTWEVAA